MADDDFDVDLSGGTSGAALTVPRQCSALRKGGYVMIKNRPCKIVEMSTSKTGKHGHAKVHYVGLDIFTNKKYEDICPSTHNVTVPNVHRCEIQVIDCDDDGFMSIMSESGEITEIKCPEKCCSEDVRSMLKDTEDTDNAVMAVIWRAIGLEEVLELKVAKHK